MTSERLFNSFMPPPPKKKTFIPQSNFLATPLETNVLYVQYISCRQVCIQTYNATVEHYAAADISPVRKAMKTSPTLDPATDARSQKTSPCHTRQLCTHSKLIRTWLRSVIDDKLYHMSSANFRTLLSLMFCWQIVIAVLRPRTFTLRC